MTIKSKYFFSFLLMLFLSLGSAIQMQAQQAMAAAKVDAKTITIGDQIKLWLEVKLGSANDKVVWPVIADSLNGLEVVEKGKIDTIVGKDTFLLRQRLLVTGFDSGQYYIPSVNFQIVSGGQISRLTTDSIAINVSTIAVDTTKAFKPIKEIVEVPFSIWDYWQIFVAAILLIAFGIFIWIYFIKNKKTNIPEKAAKVAPEKAHEKALRLLQELRQKHLWEDGRIKEYYSELTDITRTYLEERFDIAALEQTTDELLALLKKQNDARSELRKVRPELKMILRTADLAKFAKANPLPDEHTACMAAAIIVVERTQVKAGEVPS